MLVTENQGSTSTGVGPLSCAPHARELAHHAVILDGEFMGGVGADLGRRMFAAVLWTFAGPGGECSPHDGEIAARLSYPDPEGRAAGRWVQRHLQAGEGQDFRRVVGPDGRTRVGFVMLGPPPRFAPGPATTSTHAGVDGATTSTHGNSDDASIVTHDETGGASADGNTSGTTHKSNVMVAEGAMPEPSLRRATGTELSKLKLLAIEMYASAGMNGGGRNAKARADCVEFVRRLLDVESDDPRFAPHLVEDALFWIWRHGKPTRGPHATIYDRAHAAGIPLRKATSFIPIVV